MTTQLKPIRDYQGDLFVVEAIDAIIKDDMLSMEYPFYSLTKKPDREVRKFTIGESWIEFQPSAKGLPTIYDKDLIIFAISHVMQLVNEARKAGVEMEIPRHIEFEPYAFLTFTARGTGGKDYDSLADALERLSGTNIRTNIVHDGVITDRWFGLLDYAELKTDDNTKRPNKITMGLSDTIRSSIQDNKILTLNRDYFRLRKPIERRIYEIVRNFCGTQEFWSPYLKTLHERVGSKAPLREFRRAVKHLAKHNHLPDYLIDYDTDKDQVFFYPRPKFLSAMTPEMEELPPLPEWVYDRARKFLDRKDVYAAESAWRKYWKEKGCLPIDNIVGAFIGFCKNPPVDF